ncbi:MAG TPA: O-antigen ligase family protein [Polyangia bacterium]|nr:O-antigen ligase family protein [Polyangia bacterium]
MRALATRGLPTVDNPGLGLLVLAPLAALLVGAAFSFDARAGVALTLSLIYLGVALHNLPLALILWCPLIFLEGLPEFNLAAKAGGLLIVAVWLAGLSRTREHVDSVLRRTGKLWLAVAVLLLWLSLTLLWAEDRGLVLDDLWRWFAVALLMLVIATTVSNRRQATLMAAAFVVGAVMAVGVGIVSGDLTTSRTAIETASEGRLEGGQGDPNALAAGIVPAMILALALFMSHRDFAVRWLLVAALALLTLGLVASESRGGVLAAIAATFAALLVFRDRRASALAFVTLTVGVAAAWFAVSPNAWERVTDFDSGGSGRSDLWAVAWNVAEASPIEGVGLHNFTAVSGEYVRQPGSLERVDLVVDEANFVHNVYLELLAETGLIGLLLFVGVAAGSAHTAWRAARQFDASGDATMKTLAQAVVVALVGLLTSSFFLSSGVDKRLWIVFGLSPALLAIAARQQRDHHAEDGGGGAPRSALGR